MFKRITLLAFFMAIPLTTSHASGSGIIVLTLQNGALPYRILYDPPHDQYWIVNSTSGIIRLYEAEPNMWDTQYFPIEGMGDAIGPDINNNLYLCVGGYDPSIKTFNTDSMSVIRSIPLQIYPTGCTFSQDQQHLYICACTWPAIGEGWSPIDAGYHPDTGRILDFDISTGTIVNTAVVGAMPETIYLTPYNTLLVSTEEDKEILEINRCTWLVIQTGPDTIFFVPKNMWTLSMSIALKE